MLPYERFDAWQLCHAFAVAVYRVTRSWPNEERFGLTSQLRRAAFSAASNIAEGSAKKGTKEFRGFLDMSLGSLSEASYILRLAEDIGILESAERSKLDDMRDHAGKATWGLYRSLKA